MFDNPANAERWCLKMTPNPVYVILPILWWCQWIQGPSLAEVQNSEISHGLVTCSSLRVDERHSGAAAESRIKLWLMYVRLLPLGWWCLWSPAQGLILWVLWALSTYLKSRTGLSTSGVCLFVCVCLCVFVAVTYLFASHKLMWRWLIKFTSCPKLGFQENLSCSSCFVYERRF